MTTADELTELVDSYVEWLRRGIRAESLTDSLVEITTPFLDRHNDHLQVYVRRENGKVFLTDAGETIADLISSGVTVDQPRRRDQIETMARGFGVQAAHHELFVEASPSNLGQRTHSLIQAMLSVNDMYVLARSRIASLFWEDVEEYLRVNNVRFSRRIKLAGKSGYDHSIDFLIPSSSTQPERILQAVGNPNKAFVSNAIFTITDSVAARQQPMTAFALLNDQGSEVASEVLEAFANYEIRAVAWSQRETLVGELAA